MKTQSFPCKIQLYIDFTMLLPTCLLSIMWSVSYVNHCVPHTYCYRWAAQIMRLMKTCYFDRLQVANGELL